MKSKLILFFLCSIILSACGDSEKEARAVYNKALQDWNNGKIEEALKKFETISTEYLDTQTASEAINQKAILLSQYEILNSPLTNRKKNNGPIGRFATGQIDSYYRSNNVYPQNIESINNSASGALVEYFKLCQYDVAALNLGYQLDCTKAENDYQKHFNNKRITRKSLHSKKKNDLIDFSSATSYPKAENTWSNILNPTGEVSKVGFSAFYIDTKNPKNIIDREVVDDISISYSHSNFRGINSGDFGGYWVGEIECSNKKVKQISIYQGHSKTRLIIDRLRRWQK